MGTVVPKFSMTVAAAITVVHVTQKSQRAGYSLFSLLRTLIAAPRPWFPRALRWASGNVSQNLCLM